MTKINERVDHIAQAAEVILSEAKGLTRLAASLNETFNEAVELLLKAKGKIAVTGMGKSGLVARKVAATLASTGSPAFFIHPSEASHGDLGMIDPGQDVLLAYSNSGETAELSEILEYCARFKVPVLGITTVKESYLGKHSDVVFQLPRHVEACPLGCAPTTSTTMMMALGDALALSLVTARGFTLEDFRKYHPGGKLGARLLALRDLMHTGDALPLAPPTLPMSEALVIMTSKRLGCVGVLENGALLGVITDGDLRRHMGPNLLASLTEEIMTARPITFSPDTLAAKALAVMQEKSITNAFVVNPLGEPVGIVHIHDCLNAGVA
ncbi:MAG: KpsF/GutQ family sugar-phosphate isomerase [Deltaproteobacteria bacterium]|jgi:arabinose-5-phosphate isomerase|nr:KpsF/GutQ family sugar-phosphate isomerase [Deltaproteobacteria bacterium]